MDDPVSITSRLNLEMMMGLEMDGPVSHHCANGNLEMTITRLNLDIAPENRHFHWILG